MIASLLFIGGCQVDTYPEVPAFEDEFTREFLPSTEEVEEGYYLFESKTGGYQMLFPENARVSKFGYERNGDGFEFLRYDHPYDNDQIYVRHTLTYNIHEREDFERILNIRLKLLSERVGYDGDYEKLETPDKDIYYAHSIQNVKVDNESHSVLRTFAYIVPKEGMFTLEFTHSSSCNREIEAINCPIDPEEQKEDAFKMMESVKFNEF